MDGWRRVFRFCRVEIVQADEHETASAGKATAKAPGTPWHRRRSTWALAAVAVAAVLAGKIDFSGRLSAASKYKGPLHAV